MDKINLGGFQFGTSIEGEEPRSPGDPFRILLIGDFSGDNSQEISSLQPKQVDRDTCDILLAAMAPRIDKLLSSIDGSPISFCPTSLDDFHPDQLFESLEVFAEMRKLRRQLKNPNLFAAAATKILSWADAQPAIPESKEAVSESPADSPAADGPAADGPAADGPAADGPAADGPAADGPADDSEVNPAYSTEGLFDSVLETSVDNSDETDWTSMIGDIVASSKIEKVDPRVDELTDLVDKVTERVMQSILHQSSFRKLEASWRSIDRVVRSIETSGQLQVFMLDMSNEQLRSDLESETLAVSHLNRILVEQTVKTPGAKPWSVVGSMFDFGPNEEDVNALARLSQLATAGQFTVVAGAEADRETWESESAVDSWKPLRSSPGAGRLCVVWPKYLFRLPYGSRHGRVDGFAFEELSP
ncbi:MAG: type VI secretion system protein ImpC, partial [Pirellulaceae bacterium]